MEYAHTTPRKSSLALAITAALALSFTPAANAEDPAAYSSEIMVNDAQGDFFTQGLIAADGNYMLSDMGLNRYSPSHLQQGYMLAKHDDAGNLLWKDYYYGNKKYNYYTRSKMYADNAGNIYVLLTPQYDTAELIKYSADGVRTVLKTSSFIIPRGHAYNLGFDDNNNVFMIGGRYIEKYGPDGVKIWSQWFEDWSSYRAATHVTTDADGNAYVTGLTWTRDTTSLLTVKISADGNIMWADKVNNTVPVSNGQYLLRGHHSQISPEGDLVVTAGNHQQLHILKYGLDGSKKFHSIADLGGIDKRFINTHVDEQGIVTSIMPAKKTADARYGNTMDIATLRFDAAGQETMRNYVDYGFTEQLMIHRGSRGNYYFAAGSFIAKLDSDGNKLWQTNPLSTNYYGYAYNWVGTSADAGKIYAGGVLRSVNNNFDAVFHIYDQQTNQAPVADAGSYAPQECAGSLTDVQLDGSGSSDPDGDALTYSWSGSFGSASGVSPLVQLTLGDHAVALTVDDGNGGSASASASVSVVDTTAPLVSAGADVTIVADSADGAPFTVQPVAGDACGAVSISVDNTPALYPIGTSTVTVTAVDAAGNVATDTMNVTVTYDFPGVTLPPSASSPIKSGSSVPLKFTLTYADGTLVTDATPTVSLYDAAGNPVPLPTNGKGKGASGGDTFRFTGDQYIFNLNTRGLDAGEYTLVIDMGDGSTPSSSTITVK